MKVNLLLNANNRAWIIQKIAERFRDQLPAFGAEATITEEITSTENKIAFARQAFNDAVMEYNTGIESFPQNVLVGMFQFAPAKQLEATESSEERKAPKVSFS